MGYKCTECGVGYYPPRHCPSCGGQSCMVNTEYTATKALKEEIESLKKQLEEAREEIAASPYRKAEVKDAEARAETAEAKLAGCPECQRAIDLSGKLDAGYELINDLKAKLQATEKERDEAREWADRCTKDHLSLRLRGKEKEANLRADRYRKALEEIAAHLKGGCWDSAEQLARKSLDGQRE